MQTNKDREYNGYVLKNDSSLEYAVSACSYCELNKQCDDMADELNNSEYYICINGIKDTEYKRNHPNAYFKKII